MTVWLLWHLPRGHFQAMAATASRFVFSILGAMGLGVADDIIEFTAIVAFRDTNVGRYTKTALDLVFVTAGVLTKIAQGRIFAAPSG